MSEWKPIETAPIDGEPILGYCKKYNTIHIIYWGIEYEVRGHEWLDYGSGELVEDLTHWMPLPDTPKF